MSTILVGVFKIEEQKVQKILDELKKDFKVTVEQKEPGSGMIDFECTCEEPTFFWQMGAEFLKRNIVNYHLRT